MHLSRPTCRALTLCALVVCMFVLAEQPVIAQAPAPDPAPRFAEHRTLSVATPDGTAKVVIANDADTPQTMQFSVQSVPMNGASPSPIPDVSVAVEGATTIPPHGAQEYILHFRTPDDTRGTAELVASSSAGKVTLPLTWHHQASLGRYDFGIPVLVGGFLMLIGALAHALVDAKRYGKPKRVRQLEGFEWDASKSWASFTGIIGGVFALVTAASLPTEMLSLDPNVLTILSILFASAILVAPYVFSLVRGIVHLKDKYESWDLTLCIFGFILAGWCTLIGVFGEGMILWRLVTDLHDAGLIPGYAEVGLLSILAVLLVATAVWAPFATYKILDRQYTPPGMRKEDRSLAPQGKKLLRKLVARRQAPIPANRRVKDVWYPF